MDLRILLLGAVELQAGQERRRLGTPKERLTLAALAWDAGRTVGLDTLVHRVWDEHPPAKPREALYVHIHRIRKALASLAGSRAPAVVNRTHTYMLDIDPDAVDLRRFLTLVDQGRGLSDSGSSHDASSALQSASRLWAGEPLAGLPGTWPAHVRRLVGEQHLASTLLQADIALRSGRFVEAVASLRPFAEQHQMNESFAGSSLSRYTAADVRTRRPGCCSACSTTCSRSRAPTQVETSHTSTAAYLPADRPQNCCRHQRHPRPRLPSPSARTRFRPR